MPESTGSEHSYVADAQNWEQRVKAELDAAKIWEENWGPLFAPDEPHNYEDRIKKLEEEAAKIKGGRLLPQSAAYGGSGPAFREFEPRRSKGMKMKMAIAAKTGEDAANCTARAK